MLGLFGWLLYGGLAAKDKVGKHNDSTRRLENAINSGSPTYYDGKMKERLVATNELVIHATNQNGEHVLKTADHSFREVYNYTKAENERKKKECLAKGEGFYWEYNSELKKKVKIDVLTGRPFEAVRVVHSDKCGKDEMMIFKIDYICGEYKRETFFITAKRFKELGGWGANDKDLDIYFNPYRNNFDIKGEEDFRKAGR